MKQPVDETLIRYIETEILPRYETFDKAHQTDHARTVIGESLRLAQYYDVDCNVVYAVAAYHDTGLVAGRERHHEVSARIVRDDRNLPRWFSEQEIAMIADAVEDHRASAGAPPRSIYGRIVAEADRVIDCDTTLRRTVQYGLQHEPQLDREGQYARFVAHLRKKYAAGGYLRLWLPESGNVPRLEALRNRIADEALLRADFDRLYDEESRQNECSDS
ncbi:HD domain-containing protein [uncultured Alistipes sp.]|uniref:HD domain-containing protein n=1 Tax=uncultured Alistipes sp. TaxID=538949 RepID=UPI00262B659A|nr:HD domain-containing protein [uncultured Alistipes sp.]